MLSWPPFLQPTSTMIRPTEWQVLIDAPLSPPDMAVDTGTGKRGPGMGRKHINRPLWYAIDQGSLVKAQQALASGASPVSERQGETPLIGCVRRGLWEMAQLLAMAQQDSLSFHHDHLWNVLAERDNPGDLAPVAALGFDLAQVKPEVLVSQHASRLLEAWCDRHPRALPNVLQTFFSRSATGSPGFSKNGHAGLLAWLHTVAGGTPAFRTRVNEAWGIDATDPHALMQCLVGVFGEPGVSVLRQYWAHICADDDVEQAQVSVASGWAPPPPRPIKGGKKISPPFSWSLLKHGKPRITSWWFSAPEFHAEALRLLQGKPEDTWRAVCRNDATAPRRLHALNLGIDWLHTDDQGKTVAHVMAAHLNLNLKVLEDLLEIAPDLLFMVDHEGRTPFDCFPLKRMREANQSALQARLLEYRLVRATRTAAPIPPRIRM